MRISSSASYVLLHSTIGQIMLVWLRKMVLPPHYSRVSILAHESRSNSCDAPAEKSVMNMISLLLSVSDWLNHNDWSKWFAITSPSPIC
jgi:hypothetical protein